MVLIVLILISISFLCKKSLTISAFPFLTAMCNGALWIVIKMAWKYSYEILLKMYIYDNIIKILHFKWY